MAFNTEGKTISGLLGKRVYLIPRNQRRYVWKVDNWKDLIEDLSFAITDATRPHFLGSVVLEKKKDNDKGSGVDLFSIIDGQQRMTTILLFLSVIMILFKERQEKGKFEGLKSYLLTTNLSNTEFIKLDTDQYPFLDRFIKNACDWEYHFTSLQRLINDSSTALDRRSPVFDAVNFFYTKLRDVSTESSELLDGYRDALLNTNIVEIIATSDEDAYTIFEILNARGQILEDYELIKNYIMRYYEPQHDIDKAKSRWEREIVQVLGDNIPLFIRHYVTHRYAKSGNAHNFNYGIIKNQNSKNQVVGLLDDLCKKASYYQIITSPKRGEEGNCSDCEYQVFSFMKSYNGLLFRPVFLSLLHRKDTGDISNTLYERLLVFIKLYFICYNLLGRETSNKLTDIVQGTAMSLEENYSQNLLKSFVDGLIRRLPTLTEFTNSFTQIGWSKIYEFYKDSPQKKRAKIALFTLEAIESGSWDIEDFTIEHINPDSNSRDSSMVGNLLPLESNINESNKDKCLADKISSYKDSKYKTARSFYSRYNTSLSLYNPEKRANKMAERIYDELLSVQTDLVQLLS